MSSERLSAPLARLAGILRPLAGRRIALIAPAGGVRDNRIDTALLVLEAAGIDVHLGAHARDHHRYLAGTAEARLADLHAAFELPDITAVWCLRGGYGSAHIVDHIDWSRIPHDVPLVGFSDITVLLEAFRQHDCSAIHGPVATQLATRDAAAEGQIERAESIESLTNLLQGQASDWSLSHFAGPSTPVSGRLIGGNLTALASVAGTTAALRPSTDSILLLEDVGEAEYRLERSFQQLLHSVDYRHLKAVCLGQFDHCCLADGVQSLARVFAEWLEAYDIPLYHGLEMGHGLPNRAWAYNRKGLIKASRLHGVESSTECP